MTKHSAPSSTIKRLLLMTISFAILLTSCAPKMTQEQCLSNNMYQLGLMDGNAGKSINQFSEYQTQCNRHEIILDQRQYQKGWQEGNLSYCQPSTAYRLGKDGQPFPTVCTDNNLGELRREHERGLQVYQRIRVVADQIKSIDNELNQAQKIEREIDTVRYQIGQKRKKRDKKSSDSEKIAIQHEIDALEDKLNVLQTKLIVAATLSIAKEKELRQERTQLSSELERLKATP